MEVIQEMGIRNKRNSYVTEALFIAESIKYGFNISKPIGDLPYDFVLDNGSKLYRLQVKATYNTQLRKNGGKFYSINLTHSFRKVGYAVGEIDFVAALVVPANIWYILPVENIAGKVTIKLHPYRRDPSSLDGKYLYEQFRRGWELMR